MTAVGAGAVEQAFEKAINDLNKAIDKVQSLCNKLVDRLNKILRFIPSPTAQLIRAGMKKFSKLRDKIVDQVQKFLKEPGCPPALFRIGRYWEDNVGTPVSGIHQKVGAGMKADDSWSGTAASAYDDAAEAQSKAVATIKPMAVNIQNVLTDLAWGLIGFWVAMAAAYVVFAIGLAIAVGLAASVFGAPAAPPDAAATAAAVIGLILAAVVGLEQYTERVDKAMTVAKQALDDNDGLVVEGNTSHWPPMDGRIRTGGWKVRSNE